MIGCWVLVDVYFLRLSCGPGSRVQGPGRLVSCGRLLSCSCFVFLRSNLVVILLFLAVTSSISSISCGCLRFLAVMGFLRSSGSCDRRALAFSSCLRHCRFLSCLCWLLASVSTWLVVGFMFVVALAFGCRVCHCCVRWFANAGCLLPLIFCSAVSAAANPASVMAGDCCSQKCILSCCCSCGW